MRKRLVMTAIAAVVIGVAAYLLSRPRNRSLEWHQQQYTEVVFNPNIGLYGKMRWPLARTAAKAGYTNVIGAQHEQNIKSCQQALIALGYLEERTFALTNQTAAKVMSTLARTKVYKDGTSPGHISVSPTMSMVFDWEGNEVILGIAVQPGNTTGLVLVTRPRDFSVWEELLRKADAPETK